MLTPRRRNCWNAASLGLIVGMVAGSVAVAPRLVAAIPQQPPAVVPAAVLQGRVTDKQGAPLPGVRVRIAVPATDMRFVNPTTDHVLFEARSGAEGDYRLEVPGINEPTKVSIDAMLPGYRRLVGMLMMMGDAKTVELEPGKPVEANLALEPARYYRGTVVDEQGQPIAGVQIGAYSSSSQRTGGVEMTATSPDGTFELFNYPVELIKLLDNEVRKSRVNFTHPDYIAAQVDDLNPIERDQRESLRVVLPTGQKLAGTVLDTAGKPVAGALVRAGLVSGTYSKGTTTDATGHFALRGLGRGLLKVEVRAYPIKQKLRVPLLMLNADTANLELKLQPIVLPPDLKTYDVLGMRLADVTPALQAAYDLYHPKGALILDPGPDAARLEIGEIAEGNEFWMAGNNQISGLRDFIDRIIAETGGRDADIHSVRVVYNVVTAEFEGTNTQHLKVTRDDLKQLQTLAKQLKAPAR